VPAGEYPDGLAYDPIEQHIFVSDETGGIETVLNASGHRIADDHARWRGRKCPVRRRLATRLVDVQTLDELSSSTRGRIASFRDSASLAAFSDHSLLVDAVHRLAFITCNGTQSS